MVTTRHAPADTTRTILFHLAEGLTPARILREHPEITPEDIQEAAATALRVMETGESRDERIARVRLAHPHAFEPWRADEDAQLEDEFARGATIAALARAFGRPPGAIRARLERLGVEWRRDASKVHAKDAKRAKAAGEGA